MEGRTASYLDETAGAKNLDPLATEFNKGQSIERLNSMLKKNGYGTPQP